MLGRCTEHSQLRCYQQPIAFVENPNRHADPISGVAHNQEGTLEICVCIMFLQVPQVGFPCCVMIRTINDGVKYCGSDDRITADLDKHVGLTKFILSLSADDWFAPVR